MPSTSTSAKENKKESSEESDNSSTDGDDDLSYSLDKLENLVLSFMAEFLHFQSYDPGDAIHAEIPFVFNLKRKIQLMNHLLRRFEPRFQNHFKIMVMDDLHEWTKKPHCQSNPNLKPLEQIREQVLQFADKIHSKSYSAKEPEIRAKNLSKFIAELKTTPYKVKSEDSEGKVRKKVSETGSGSQRVVPATHYNQVVNKLLPKSPTPSSPSRGQPEVENSQNSANTKPTQLHFSAYPFPPYSTRALESYTREQQQVKEIPDRTPSGPPPSPEAVIAPVLTEKLPGNPKVATTKAANPIKVKAELARELVVNRKQSSTGTGGTIPRQRSPLNFDYAKMLENEKGKQSTVKETNQSPHDVKTSRSEPASQSQPNVGIQPEPQLQLDANPQNKIQQKNPHKRNAFSALSVHAISQEKRSEQCGECGDSNRRRYKPQNLANQTSSTKSEGLYFASKPYSSTEHVSVAENQKATKSRSGQNQNKAENVENPAQPQVSELRQAQNDYKMAKIPYGKLLRLEAELARNQQRLAAAAAKSPQIELKNVKIGTPNNSVGTEIKKTRQKSTTASEPEKKEHELADILYWPVSNCDNEQTEPRMGSDEEKKIHAAIIANDPWNSASNKNKTAPDGISPAGKGNGDPESFEGSPIENHEATTNSKRVLANKIMKRNSWYQATTQTDSIQRAKTAENFSKWIKASTGSYTNSVKESRVPGAVNRINPDERFVHNFVEKDFNGSASAQETSENFNFGCQPSSFKKATRNVAIKHLLPDLKRKEPESRTFQNKVIPKQFQSSAIAKLPIGTGSRPFGIR